MRRFIGFAALALSIGSGTAAEAHHAISGMVDVNHTVEMKATLTRIDWINPHIGLHFEAKDANGKVAKVPVEWLAIAGMVRAGVKSADLLKTGKTYGISFYPNRDGSLGGHMAKLTLPDGHVLTRQGIEETPSQ